MKDLITSKPTKFPTVLVNRKDLVVASPLTSPKALCAPRWGPGEVTGSWVGDPGLAHHGFMAGSEVGKFSLVTWCHLVASGLLAELHFC